METLDGIIFKKPFPHLIINDFYNEKELKLIWEELSFYTKPGKFLEAKYFGGIVNKTNSHALALDGVYREEYRNLSNILTVNRKLFDTELLKTFSDIDDCCSIALTSNWDITKVRYYHHDEYYEPHTDRDFQFLAFSYFYKEPKKFRGGEVYFPDYDYELPCNNNSMIILPGWVQHGVRKVNIEDSDYYDGYGRYCISSFFGNKGK
jgi:Rps23 Pro-64 3,4-dihydroxylase Tpa1-like proline 4-hydroxylase